MSQEIENDEQDAEAPPVLSPTREKIHEIIFEADTFWGTVFDVALLLAILASLVIVCWQSVEGFGFDKNTNTFQSQAAKNLYWISWGFTILFTIEYLLRLYCVRRPTRYATSFWGLIDLFSFLPDYLLIVSGTGRSFSVLRSLRLLRVFRILRLSWFQDEAEELGSAIWRSRAKIVVFLFAVMVIVTMAGTLMYEVEKYGDDSLFKNIPEGIYWAIVTMTTVGFGDIVPRTTAGKFLSAFVILLGYSLIIVPTGFVSAEIIDSKKRKKNIVARSCSSCVTEGHDEDALYCKYCGEKM